MSIRNTKVESTGLHTVELREAVTKDGVDVEGILLEPFIVSFDWKRDGEWERWRIELDVGFAAAPSIPGFVRSIVPATGATRWAGFPHDWITEFHSMSRADGDSLWVGVVKFLGGGLWTQGWSWTAIRSFGWWAWRKNEGTVTLIGLTRVEG